MVGEAYAQWWFTEVPRNCLPELWACTLEQHNHGVRWPPDREGEVPVSVLGWIYICPVAAYRGTKELPSRAVGSGGSHAGLVQWFSKAQKLSSRMLGSGPSHVHLAAAHRSTQELPASIVGSGPPYVHLAAAHRSIQELLAGRVGSGRPPHWSNVTTVSRDWQPGKGKSQYLTREPCALGGGCIGAAGLWVRQYNLGWSGLHGPRHCPRPVWVVVSLGS